VSKAIGLHAPDEEKEIDSVTTGRGTGGTPLSLPSKEAPADSRSGGGGVAQSSTAPLHRRVASAPLTLGEEAEGLDGQLMLPPAHPPSAQGHVGGAGGGGGGGAHLPRVLQLKQ